MFKYMVIVLLVVVFVVGCQSNDEPENSVQEPPEWEEPHSNNLPEETDKNSNENDEQPLLGETGDKGDQYALELIIKHNQEWISAAQLADLTSGTYDLDEVDGTLYMTVFDIPFYFVKDVPVVERNRLYMPYDMQALFLEYEEVLLPVTFLNVALEVEVIRELEDQAQDKQEQVIFYVDEQVKQVFSDHQQDKAVLAYLSKDDVVDYLSFLSNPIPGARISTQASHLPGAPRPYRNGFHEGIDWYSGTSGQQIDRNTTVHSIADGVIVRADHDYVELEAAERKEQLSWSAQLTDTPEYILDKLRGRQVWVQYEDGVMMRYAHLSRIEDALEVGQSVNSGDVLGYVGNSGTSYAIAGDLQGGLHLHADLLVYGELFWEYLDDPNDVRTVLEVVFHGE